MSASGVRRIFPVVTSVLCGVSSWREDPRLACAAPRGDSPLQRVLEVGERLQDLLVGDVQRAADDAEHRVGTLRLHLVDDELVEPAGVDGVELEVVRLEQLDEVLNRGAEVAADRQLLQRDHHVPANKQTHVSQVSTCCAGTLQLNANRVRRKVDSLARALAILAPREAVAELRVCELVQGAGGRHAEVPPHVLTAAEVQLRHRARRRLEPLQTRQHQTGYKTTINRLERTGVSGTQIVFCGS